MSVMQAIIVFGVSWWLILFLALPVGVKTLEKPEKGHAPSAPEKVNLKQKLKWVTWLAFSLTIVAYFLVPALAEAGQKGVYSTGAAQETRQDCAPLPAHNPADNVAVKDGHGTGGNRVKGANLGGNHPIYNHLHYVDIPLELPVSDYTDTSAHNANLSETRIRPGTITVDTQQGEARLNGVHLSDTPLYNEDCIRNKKSSIYSTK